MKKLFLTLAMFLTLGLSFQGVAAQLVDLDTDTPPVGLEYSYQRSYMPDLDAIMADPDFDFDTFDFAEAMSGFAGIAVTGFDSHENAMAYYADAKAEVLVAIQEEETPPTVTELEDFGHEGVLVAGEDEGMSIAMLFFVDDTDIFMVMAMGADVDAATERVMQIGEYIRDAEVQTDEVTFAEDGSTGGVFDRMPPADHELVEGLIIEDEAFDPVG